MDCKRVFDLSVELIERMDIAHKEAQFIHMGEGDRDLFFIHDGDRELVNPRYLSFEKHCEIVQLSKFVRQCRDIDSESLKKILGMNKTKFQFLIEVESVVPNLVEEIRGHEDEKYISYLYAANKMFSNKEKGLGC